MKTRKQRKRITPPAVRLEILHLLKTGVLTPTTASERYNISRQTIYSMIRTSGVDYCRYKTHLGNKFAIKKSK
jgi:copper homeostasis protein CutC